MIDINVIPYIAFEEALLGKEIVTENVSQLLLSIKCINLIYNMATGKVSTRCCRLSWITKFDTTYFDIEIMELKQQFCDNTHIVL